MRYLIRNPFSILMCVIVFFCQEVSAITYTPTNVLNALSSDGTLVTLSQVDGNDGSHSIQSVRFPAGGGPLQSFGTISDPTLTATVPQLAINDFGNAVASWLELGVNGLYALKIGTLLSTDSSYQTTTLSQVGEHVIKFTLNVDTSIGTGRASVIWYSYNTNTDTTNAWIATAVFGGSFTTTQLY